MHVFTKARATANFFRPFSVYQTEHQKEEFTMKRLVSLSALLALVLMLAGCSAAAPQPPEEPADEPVTLEELCGDDYQAYITETIEMQMGNRMDKTPEVTYFPITDKAPLTDYVAIDETTSFYVDEDGHIVIVFPAGTVTDEAHGEQTFRIPRP